MLYDVSYSSINMEHTVGRGKERAAGVDVGGIQLKSRTEPEKKKHDKQKLDKQTVKQPVPTYVLWTSNIYLIQINKLPYGTFP